MQNPLSPLSPSALPLSTPPSLIALLRLGTRASYGTGLDLTYLGGNQPSPISRAHLAPQTSDGATPPHTGLASSLSRPPLLQPTHVTPTLLGCIDGGSSDWSSREVEWPDCWGRGAPAEERVPSLPPSAQHHTQPAHHSNTPSGRRHHRQPSAGTSPPTPTTPPPPPTQPPANPPPPGDDGGPANPRSGGSSSPPHLPQPSLPWDLMGNVEGGVPAGLVAAGRL
ncbi:hypothetical protein DFH27DRAFT_579153 [Peziza echinospora]|nr:hypothetical protein DFH27DRAFT_579153 [Peziza echinospora]